MPSGSSGPLSVVLKQAGTCPTSHGPSSAEVSKGWLYFKLYTALAIGGVEYLITEMLPEVLRCSQFNPWFFLRYVDAGGPHLRLRLWCSDADIDAVGDSVETIARRHLRSLPSVWNSPYRAVIHAPVWQMRMQAGSARVERHVYRPETHKFGVQGMVIAERLFQASSLVAMRMLLEERSNSYSRKTLIPILMSSVFEAFPKGADRASFWEAYAGFWLRTEEHIADRWTRLFIAKSNNLNSSGIHVLADDAILPTGALNNVHAWRSALALAAKEYAETPDQTERHDEALASHFIHLMNNRIGLMPLEESYFATLLAQCAKIRHVP